MKLIRKSILALALCLACAAAPARTMLEEITETPEKSGGVYFAYPVAESLNTPAPEGYTPFYISHYARHGSRYLISDNDYKWLIDLMEKARLADALTPLGNDVAARLTALWEEARGRGGDLTPLGQRQHNGIGARMYDSFPEVFAPGAQMHASSTTVLRCSLSMSACCEGLTKKAPYLEIPRESSERHMHYLNYHDEPSQRFTASDAPWRKAYSEFEKAHTDGSRLAASLFSDRQFVADNVNPDKLLQGLFWVAVDMQNMETPISFFDIFTPEELYGQWQCTNLHFYICDSNYAGNNGLMLGNARPLLRNILETAQSYIDSGSHGATLRFGHDGNIIPLTGLLGLPECANSVSDFDSVPDAFRVNYVAPMAANIQIIFFRNPDNDVIVKFMHNEREQPIPVETDIYPFYHWADVKAYYSNLL